MNGSWKKTTVLLLLGALLASCGETAAPAESGTETSSSAGKNAETAAVTEAAETEPVMEYNPSLPRGTQNVKKKARTGYEVQTYKVYYYNGYEYDRVLMCDSVYKMIQQVIEYNN